MPLSDLIVSTTPSDGLLALTSMILPEGSISIKSGEYFLYCSLKQTLN